MPSYPTIPIPRLVTPFGYSDAAFVSQFDGGARSSRARYLKWRAMLRLDYLATMEDVHILQDFWQDVRGTVLPFDFTYPYPHTGITADSATPVRVDTQVAHGYHSGDQVVITNANATVNGTQTITRLSATAFSVDGTSGGGGASSGEVARFLPAVFFTTDIFPTPGPIMGYGAGFDASALMPVTLSIQE